MKNWVQSSRCLQPWGFFIFQRHFAYALALLIIGLAWILLYPGFTEAHDHSSSTMKRRQQGILTGMPFMANVAPRTFVDDTGRKLYLAKPPKRIVSLAPSITEMLFALGLNEEIVGVTEFCDYPPAAQEKPKIGYSQPNLEILVALQPDLVLAPQSFLRADLLAKLEQLKIPTFILEPKTVEDILAHIRLLGRMVGRTTAAVKESERIRKHVAGLSARLENLPRPRLLYVLNSDPLITVGPGSYIHHLIELAGGQNVAAGAHTAYPRLSLEEVLKQDPEYLLFPVGKFEGITQEEQDTWRQWTGLSAVQADRLFQIPSDLLNRPGPRIGEGLDILVRVLHPEILSDTASQPLSP